MFSIASLNVLRMDYLKIDGRYVKDIAQDRIAQTLVQAINLVTHEMAAKTVAGWTESSAILCTLEGIGVDHAQGYAISRPRPLAELGNVQEPVAKESKRLSKAESLPKQQQIN